MAEWNCSNYLLPLFQITLFNYLLGPLNGLKQSFILD